MPEKNFPRLMKDAASMPGVKKAFLLDFDGTNNGGCDNCGGMGYLYLFIATEGPFQSPGAPYREDKSSHWYDGKWWIGTSSAFMCPNCHGLGYIENGRPRVFVQHDRAEHAVAEVAERLEA